MRFIDLARDGGCSKKACALDVGEMLTAVAQRCSSTDLTTAARQFPDVSRATLPGPEVICTIDAIYPNTNNPTDFGEIAANHAMTDIYAGFGVPKLALSILGIPNGYSAKDEIIVDMLAGAARVLAAHGAPLLGGHTLARQTELFLGFSIVGVPLPIERAPFPPPNEGDPIFATKRLGTSIATGLWKTNDSFSDEFSDVLEGMKASVSGTASTLYRLGVRDCTDITGYGLLNHLHLLLRRANVGGILVLSNIQKYQSLAQVEAELPTTAQYYHNLEFSETFSNSAELIDHPDMPFVSDGQVGGGLLFTCPRAAEEIVIHSVRSLGDEITCIGRISAGPTGHVEIYA